MDVEILSVELNKGIVYFYCNDISDENLRRLERMRDDATEEEVVFSFDTHESFKNFKSLVAQSKNNTRFYNVG